MSLFHSDMNVNERIKALEQHVLALEARIVALDDRHDLDMRRIDVQLSARQQAATVSLLRRMFGSPKGL